MILSQPPCKDCAGRYIGCHSGCPTWQEWKSDDDRKKAEIKAAKDREKDLDDFMFTAMHRINLDACRRANKRARS